MLLEVDLVKVQRIADLLNISEETVRLSIAPFDIEQATTIEQASDACNAAPSGSLAQRLAMEKWNELSKQQVEGATTIEQAEAAYNVAPRDSVAECLAIRKLYELA